MVHITKVFAGVGKWKGNIQSGNLIKDAEAASKAWILLAK
jgi:hypothetical protein